MAYEVRLSSRAVKDLLRIYEAKDAAISRPAAEWYLGLRDTIFGLEHLPHRGSAAPDKPNLLQILYGNKPHFYRILYTIDEANRAVNVAQVRHGARKPLR